MRVLTFCKGAAIGALMMYLFDPDRGRSRRAKIRDTSVRAWNDTGDAIEACTRDFSNRARGVVHDASALLSPADCMRGASRAIRGSGLLPERWSPTTRLIVTACAGLLAFYGKRRGDLVGAALGAASVALITGTVARSDMERIAGSAPALPTDYPIEHHASSGEHQPRVAESS